MLSMPPAIAASIFQWAICQCGCNNRLRARATHAIDGHARNRHRTPPPIAAWRALDSILLPAWMTLPFMITLPIWAASTPAQA